MSQLLAAVRAFLFYVVYVLATILWGGGATLLAWALPYRARFQVVIVWWSRFVLWWLKITCGVKVEVEGLEHIPAEPCVVLAKHQSTWETLFLQGLFAPQATVIKKQLLYIPFFGWAFSLLAPIAIDRSDRRAALRKLVALGQQRLAEKIWVVLFPEGTRLPPGEVGRFQRGGAAIATGAGQPVLVVAHNAGWYWPAHRLLKNSGTIRLRISPPMRVSDSDTGISTQGRAAELNRMAETWMQQTMPELDALAKAEVQGR